MLYLILLCGYMIFYGFCCLPGAFSPGFGAGYYAPYAPRLGPYRSEEHHHHTSHSHDHHTGARQLQRDQIQTISSLNCPTFAENCKWANTNDEELDWTTLQALPEPDKYLSALDVENYPDAAAAALVSNARSGWEGGQLISDSLPCLSPGIQITATAWRTLSASPSELPKLQICAKNANEAMTPLLNCDEFNINNGVPVTMNVPTPTHPNQPTQIVFYGNNFVSPMGGAIFLQDILLQGNLECNGMSREDYPVLYQGRETEEALLPEQARAEKSQEISKPLKIIDDLSTLEAIVGSPTEINKQLKKSSNMVDFPDGKDIDDLVENPLLEPVEGPVGLPPSPPFPSSAENSLYETCLALACDPSDLSCKFWRSSGDHRWEIGTQGRPANPLTGVRGPPETAQKFLVAPFLDRNVRKYVLVSDVIATPAAEPVFFCFYEYFATQGLSLSVCTEDMNCFYKKVSVELGESIAENKKWNTRCAKLPQGRYELRVVAENLGDNKGELGFLPIRLARDSAGQDKIC